LAYNFLKFFARLENHQRAIFYISWAKQNNLSIKSSSGKEGLTKENIIVKLKMIYDIRHLQFTRLIGGVVKGAWGFRPHARKKLLDSLKKKEDILVRLPERFQ